MASARMGSPFRLHRVPEHYSGDSRPARNFCDAGNQSVIPVPHDPTCPNRQQPHSCSAGTRAAWHRVMALPAPCHTLERTRATQDDRTQRLDESLLYRTPAAPGRHRCRRLGRVRPHCRARNRSSSHESTAALTGERKRTPKAVSPHNAVPSHCA